MKTCSPEEVGLSGKRLERIRPAFQKLIAAKMAPGFQVAIARNGKLAYWDRFGLRDVENKLPIENDTIFRIYSMSKPITTTALMILYEEGRVLMQTPVSRYIPAFKDLKVYAGQVDGAMTYEPLKREIMVIDLAIHTSGLGYGLFTDSPVEDLYRQSGILNQSTLTFRLALSEAIRHITDLPLANQPGQRWRYSIAIDVIGYLVQLISGKPFDVFLKERVFDPLGMVDTGFFVPAKDISRLATLYEPDSHGLIKCVDQAEGSPFTNVDATPSGGGGLVSTTSDYLRFDLMMLNGGELDGVRILGPLTVEKMHRNHLSAALLPISAGGVDSPGVGFGPGFGINMNEGASNFAASEGSYYWGGAASTFAYIDPREELVGVMMTQVINNTVLFDQIFRQLVSQAILS